MIEAVVFDMDGLLIDSEPHWRRSHVSVLAQYGYEITEDDVRAAAGTRTLDQARKWQERFGFDKPSVEDLADEIVDSVIAAIHTHGEPMAGVVELVKELHEHGVPMAVASSSSHRLIDVVLERLDIRKYMQAVHSGEDEERGKPFPDVFLSTAKSLKVAPEKCLVFEDSLNGVKAAKAAGMRCIAVPEHPFDRELFEAAKPDKIVATLEEVHWADISSLQ